ncbi:TPA: hypothetical protein ACH3X2_012712 [Trebouxia sp. C0005]
MPSAPSTSRRPDTVNQQGIISSSLLSVGSSLKTVGNHAGRGLLKAVSAGYGHLTNDPTDRENVLYVKFSQLESKTTAGLQQQTVLLLGYEHGFQVWDLQDCAQIQELVSRRDGAVSFLASLPWPQQPPRPSSPSCNAWPVLAIVPSPTADSATPSHSSTSSSHCVQLYSLQSHSYLHSLSFSSRVLSLKCSPRLIVVALDAQIHAFDTANLQHTFSAVTYSMSAALQTVKAESHHSGSTPMALGTAWLAYASNQAVSHMTAQATPLSPSRPSMVGTHPTRNGHVNTHYDSLSLYAKAYARQSGLHLKGLGEAGFKYLSGAVENWRAGGADNDAVGLSPRGDQEKTDPQVVGTVMVRDVVNRQLVAHFRAHTSPLLALQFDPSGTLLVTASLHGHNVHIFHICPWHGTGAPKEGSARPLASAVHLYTLARGITPAVIRDLTFSRDGAWLGVSSARGTTHLFRLATKEGQPAHMAAASFPHTHSKGGPPSGLSTSHEPVRLTAIGRARCGGFLNGSLPGSAAAAAVVNLYTGHPGKGDIAAAFRPSQQATDPHSETHTQIDSATQSGSLQEDLFVMTATGGLVRHQLRLQAKAQSEPGLAAADRDRVGVDGEGAGGSVLMLVAEPQESWDLCRRSSWPEREEVMQPSVDLHGGPSPQKPAAHSGSEPAWMVHAETQTCSSSQVPLWADEQLAFLQLSRPPGHAGDDEECVQPHAQQRSWSKMEELPSRHIHAGRHAAAAAAASPQRYPPTIVFSAPAPEALSRQQSAPASGTTPLPQAVDHTRNIACGSAAASDGTHTGHSRAARSHRSRGGADAVCGKGKANTANAAAA